MMKQIEKQNILQQFDRLLKEIDNGQEIIVMDKQNAVAKIVKVTPDDRSRLKENENDKWTADDFNLSVSDDS